ncbi:hypothetical protein ACWIUD_06365 [Helicobacter sp. 23-1044]
MEQNTQGKIIRSGEDIKQILQRFAFENKVNPLTLDYNLISYKTFILKDGARENIANDAIKNYIDSNNFITQDYEIEIFRRNTSFYPILIQVQSNESATALTANIATQRIPQNGNLSEIIYQTILNICAYRGIIINMGWGDLSDKIANIALKLRSSDTHPEFYTIDICKLKEPNINTPATRLLLSKSQNDAILSLESPLLSGGFFKVESGEILLKYQKPHYAFPWRNIYGKLYGVAMSYPIGISAGENIAVAQKDDFIIYTAESSGYVSIVNGVMMISKSIIVDNINAKNIQNIKEQCVKSLIVKNDTLLKDAIPSGVNLEVDDLKIIGNVGAVEIKSQNLFLNGQVHLKSNLFAKKAQILHLKGRLSAKEAQIRHCENAEIKCDNLQINYLNGSKLYFDFAQISHIQSNNMLFIQKSLTAKNIRGENNEFILYPCSYGAKKAEFDNLNEKLFAIKKFKNLIMQDKNGIISLKNNSDLLLEQMLGKNHQIPAWAEQINALKLKNRRIHEIYNNYFALISDIEAKEANALAQIRAKQEEMFEIEVQFEEKASVGFFVRFVDFEGTMRRYFINASQNNQLKRISLAKGDDEKIKIMCYRD